MNLITYLVVVSTCGVLLVIIPLLLLAGNDSRIKPKFSSDCSFTEALQNSNALYILHLSIVLSILPSAVEVGMDIIEQKAVYLSSVHSNERFLFCAAMLAMSIIFLMFRSSDIFPLIYIGEYYCRNILFNCLTTIIVSTIAQVFGADATFYLYLYEDNAAMCQILETVSRVLLFVSALVWAFAKFRWLRLIMIRYKTCFIKFGQLSFSEKRYLLVQVPTILFGIMRVFRYTFYTSENEVQKGYWPSQTENSLIVDISAQYLFLAVASRRVIRDLVITNTNTLRLKQTFVRHVSHEIRSPLNVVHAGLDLLVSEIKDADPEAGTVPISRSTVELIYWIFSSSESAIEILNDLLQYEQMDAGIFNLELSWRELGGSLHNKLNWAQLMADRGNITLSIVDSTSASRCNNSNRSGDADIENGGLMEPWLLLQRDAYFHMDVFRIDQVIRNIITNAMKFTSAGGRVQINIMCEMQNHDNRNKIISKFGVDAVGLFRLEVVDTGVGLSVEDQERIFGEFTQFNKNELQGGGGSGLGLWISKRIVQMHKGTMGAHSAGLGCGTTVYFELPLFSAATAGKQPVLAPLLPSHQPTSQQVFVGDSLIEREHSSVLLNAVFSTPEKRKPLPFASPPLTGSAIHIVDSSSDKSDDEGPFISRQLRQKPQQRGEAWMPDLEINQVAESPLAKEMDGLHPQQQLLQQVSQVLDFGGGKEDDDDVITPVDQPQQMSILVVDDSALNRKVIVKIIESEKTGRLKNARILEADDGTTAVEMLRREMSEGRKIDFVLMDYVMIKMHGPEAATIMRQDIQYTSTIIAVTGNALPDDMARFIASGANLVVTKPLTKMKLMNALEQFIPP